MDHGGTRGMAWVVDGNALGFAEQGEGILESAACASLTHEAHRALERHSRLLDARREAGCVRQCHGDLHLRNIVLFDGEPTLFDAIEFNDELACIDVHYDLAFLLMDLWRRRLPHHANAVLNGYLASTADFDGLAALQPLRLVRREGGPGRADRGFRPALRERRRPRGLDDLLGTLDLRGAHAGASDADPRAEERSLFARDALCFALPLAVLVGCATPVVQAEPMLWKDSAPGTTVAPELARFNDLLSQLAERMKKNYFTWHAHGDHVHVKGSFSYALITGVKPA